MRRPLKWTLFGLAVAVFLSALLVLSVIFMLNTEAGSRWTVSRLAARMPGVTVVNGVEGTLWRGLRIPELEFRDAASETRIIDIDLRTDWGPLASGRLVLSTLDIGAVRHRDLREGPPEAFSLDLQAPGFPVRIGGARIGLLELTGRGTASVFSGLELLGASLDDKRLQFESLSVKTQGLLLTATTGRLGLEGDIPLRSVFDWSTLDNAWSGHGKLSGSLAAVAFEQRFSGPYPFAASGTIAVLGRIEPEIEATLGWDRWSFDGMHLDEGTVNLLGTMEDYAAEYSMVAELPDGLYVQVTGTARGSTASLSRFDASFESRAGSATATGELAWSPALTGAAEIDLRGFDPSIVEPRLSGSLDVAARVTMPDIEQFSASFAAVTGKLNGLDVAGEGTFGWAPAGIRCDRCEFAAGANRFALHGVTGKEDLAFDLSVEAPALAELWPDLEGGLHAAGRLDGPRLQPRFTGDVRGERLQLADWGMDGLAIESRASGIDEVNLSLRADGLRMGETGLGVLDVLARGSMDQLGVEADWQRGDLRAEASARLRLAGREISGVVERANFHEPGTGDWVLADPFEFQSSAGAFEAGSLAWSGAGGNLAVTRVRMANRRFELVAGLDGLPLQTANMFLPDGYRLDGTVAADIDIASEAGAWTGFVDWRHTGTRLSVLQADGEQVEIQISRAHARAGFRDGGAEITAALTVDPGVTGDLEMRLDRLAPDSSMTGELRLAGSEWDWVPSVIPVIDLFEGRLAARIAASGALASPDFSGKIEWRDGSLFVPALNVPLENIALDVTGAPHGAAIISGSLSAGAGHLELSGRVEDIMSGDRSVELGIKGLDAALLNWPEYQLWATPNLVVRGDANGWVLRGSMQVPRAAVAVVELPAEAVSPSPDVVVLGEIGAVAKPTSYSGDIGVTLGDSVHIEAFGLDTRITGSLRLRIPATGPIRGDGHLKLVDGRFEAFGQKLAIEQGSLTFTGPLDNPLVDVRAQRVIESIDGTITAGIHLRGRAQSLNSSVYSEPAMAEADALSYLAFGRPLHQASETEGNELAGAAIALGLGQANRITAQIGRRLGLDQLLIAGDGGDATALIAGKQINQRLYARYAYGVFSRIGSLLLRYKISQRLMLEAGAGEMQTIDILYTREKK